MIVPHIEIPVSSLKDGLSFYQALLGIRPQVLADGHAVFRASNPSMSLRLVEQHGKQEKPPGNHGHFGVQMKSSAALTDYQRRFAEIGVRLKVTQNDVECCGSVQNKIWVEDQDRNGWELFVVIEQDVGGGCGDDVESCVNCPCNFA